MYSSGSQIRPPGKLCNPSIRPLNRPITRPLCQSDHHLIRPVALYCNQSTFRKAGNSPMRPKRRVLSRLSQGGLITVAKEVALGYNAVCAVLQNRAYRIVPQRDLQGPPYLIGEPYAYMRIRHRSQNTPIYEYTPYSCITPST